MDKVQASKQFTAINNEPVDIPYYIAENMPPEHMPITISVIQGTLDFKESQLELCEKGTPITRDDLREGKAKKRLILARRRDKF